MDFQQKIHEIEILIRQEKFSEALGELEILDNLLDIQISSNEKGCIEYQISKCLYNLGRYKEALTRAESAFKRYRDSSENTRVAQTQILLAKIAFALGNLRDAEQYACDAISTNRRIENQTQLSHSYALLAHICFVTGNLERSTEHLVMATDLAKSTQNTKMIAHMQGNLGRIQTLAGDWEPAEENLKASLNYNREKKNEPSQCIDLLSLGYIYSLRGEYKRSEDILLKAYELSEKNNLSREMGIYYEYAGHLAFCMGYEKIASTNYSKAIDMATTNAPNKSLIAQTYRLWAELLVDQNQIDKALTYCYESLQASKSLGEKVEEGVAYRILGQIFSIKGDQEESRRHFESALVLLQRLGIKYELAKANLEAGKSQVFDYHERMGYLCNAERLFKELNLRFWLGLVNLGMADLLFEQRQCDNAQIFLTEAEKLFNELNDRKQMRKVSDMRHSIESALFESNMVAKSNGKVTFDNVVTRNTEMREIIEKLKQIEDYDISILLEGETGSGKDLLAKASHYSSCRRNKRFVAINCAALPESLLENELSGHKKGAYTGADKDKSGLFEEAEGGTLYLDQVEEIPLAMQVKLLRAIEEKEITRLGETKPRKIDVRIICSSIKNLKEMVKNGKFREDLYYRISTFEIKIPPLRGRKEDILVLINHFLKQYGVRERKIKELISNGTMEKFLAYAWPGNIRELDNCIKRIAILSEATGTTLSEFLPDELKQSSKEAVHKKSKSLRERIDDFERNEIIMALEENNWNKSKAARGLGEPEGTIRSKMKRLNITPCKFVA